MATRALQHSIQHIVVESVPGSHSGADQISADRNHEVTQIGELREVVMLSAASL